MGLYVNDTLEEIAGIRFRNQANQNSINHQGVLYKSSCWAPSESDKPLGEACDIGVVWRILKCSLV